ncbi:MAG: ATPase [Tabrizicola sp.]|nr:ATPase [Tabrizicola sp.]
MTDYANIRFEIADNIANITLNRPERLQALVKVHAAGLGLAGANAAGAARGLRLTLPFAVSRIETDAVATVKGALGDGDGIVAAVGTGSVFARQSGGAIHQIGGWGLTLGDEGSGAWIGRRFLSQAMRAVDGFQPLTPLMSALIAELGGPSDVVTFAGQARPAAFAALAPRILDAGETVAAEAVAESPRPSILLQQATPLSVVFIGGLGEFYAAALADRWHIAAPRGSALDGALLLAYEAG